MATKRDINNKMNEAKIIGAVSETLKGNKESFREIIRAYERPLYKLALSFLKNPEEAEDALQEIFIKVYESLGSFKLGYDFSPWIYTVAMNELRQIYRGKKKIKNIANFTQTNSSEKQETPLESLSADNQPGYINPEENLEKTEERRQVLRAIESLKENLKEVVILYYLNDMSIEEISAILNIGKENVKSRLHRARKKLKKILEGNAT